jgi:hypothetical protein
MTAAPPADRAAASRRISVARSVLELAPILCAACAQPFLLEDDEER